MRVIVPLIASTFFLFDGANAQEFSFKENSDPAVISEARANIASAGGECPSVATVWHVVQDEKIQPVFKVDCSNGDSYQLTIVGNKIYVKPWTGTIIGN